MCTCCFETQSSPGCTCTRKSKFLTHSLSFDWIFPNQIPKSKETFKVWQQFQYSMTIRRLRKWDEPDLNAKLLSPKFLSPSPYDRSEGGVSSNGGVTSFNDTSCSKEVTFFFFLNVENSDQSFLFGRVKLQGIRVSPGSFSLQKNIYWKDLVK